MKRGRFITLEGGEGTGKSTQLGLLAEALRERGIEILATREPGGSPGAEDIRRLLVEGEVGRWDPMTETLLHLAARRDHVTRTILPALNSGTWVISDRFADSTLAYQGVGQGLGRERVADLSKIAIHEIVPDLTLILDLAVEAGLKRATGRRGGKHRYERMDRAFHERLRQGFLEIAECEPERCAVIDASGSVKKTGRKILETVAERLTLEAA